MRSKTCHKCGQDIAPLFPDAVPAEKKKPRDPIWDAVCSVFDIDARPKTVATRVGKLAKDFKALEATPAEISKRAAIYRRKYPRVACTPEAVVKHWGSLFDGTKITNNNYRWTLEDEQALQAEIAMRREKNAPMISIEYFAVNVLRKSRAPTADERKAVMG